ncbi:hypothetical protein EVG20_g10449 [Dentipellis fragilis]|uniref:Uncharacterized protein n=1 Tax=Dentipellis fragilis TaxID=205917 RepID=A0A4Y9XSE3_9AGAM|nr:hypothetical protein EVG20_g10449 [Dentipellis fragilis]
MLKHEADEASPHVEEVHQVARFATHRPSPHLDDDGPQRRRAAASATAASAAGARVAAFGVGIQPRAVRDLALSIAVPDRQECACCDLAVAAAYMKSHGDKAITGRDKAICAVAGGRDKSDAGDLKMEAVRADCEIMRITLRAIQQSWGRSKGRLEAAHATGFRGTHVGPEHVPYPGVLPRDGTGFQDVWAAHARICARAPHRLDGVFLCASVLTLRQHTCVLHGSRRLGAY